ncbi:MAG: hypothetical protein HYU66_25005 [Armatimonadetes bacterium]|nr:hypothetical protein [Armatimonadota bacterium]
MELQHAQMKREGLRVERLQMKTAEALMRALALYWVVGWRSMELCYEAREHPELAAAERFTAEELQVLTVLRGSPVRTLGEAVATVAKLGGWPGYRSSPPYGPKVVQWGLEKLGTMVAYHRMLNVGQLGNNDTG